VPLFPFVRLFAPFRHYAIGFVFLALIAHQASQIISRETAPIQTEDPRLADVVAYEDLLKQKTEQVLKRFDAGQHTIDLSVSLDHTTIRTTTFDPGDNQTTTSETIAGLRSRDLRNDINNDSGTWQEEISTSPRLRSIKVCITLSQEDKIDEDQLFRSLSYALGIDLKRGDMLRIVVI
jgi:hypothetical protein